LANKTSKCRICDKFFDSKKKLKNHIDEAHRVASHMIIGSGEAERIAENILSLKNEILSVSIIDKTGNIIAAKSRVSFMKKFEVAGSEDAEYRYGGTLAIASLSVVNEVKDIVGETQAIITIHKYCKLMLLPMVSYGTLIGLALERSADAENDTFINKIERLVAHTLMLE
jgi:hypothetical protein